jgi:hypothetical protein
VKFAELSGVTDETAFLTEEMTEGDFNDKIKAFDLITRIRTAF